ncbi:hypothetical protein GCM10025857_05740 [Alicyclobacillus contaminans]|nr:hypothetical protein GCM10025857_05740 [Alicyclobacillus contaminans]
MIVSTSDNQKSLFDLEPNTKSQTPVECLGMAFENDEARREYFMRLFRQGLEELHAKLGGVTFTTVEDALERLQSIEKWPMGEEERLRDLAKRMATAHQEEPNKDLLQLWKDEVGFPHGNVEDILYLSDPPYYTACPNPFIRDFIKRYGGPYNPETAPYHREPFAADVSEGKNDPIYNAHSYHTKVPHKAIMRYILHYTEPGDVVFDGFCGTGMAGVAARFCGDRKAVESLGYHVDENGVIYQQETDENGETAWVPFSKIGERRAILNDLSPAATFIAYNYNTQIDVRIFESEAKRILKILEDECGWMYQTLHEPTDEQLQEALSQLEKLPIQNSGGLNTSLPWGRINYTVWSDVFICPECAGEVVFWEAAVDKEAGKVHTTFPCPHCSVNLSKRSMERAWVAKYDRAIGQTIRQAKQVPVLINYNVGKRRFEKSPDAFDLALIEKIEQMDIPYWFPTNRMPDGYNTEQPKVSHGLTHVHHFYTKRNLWSLASFNAQRRGTTLDKRFVPILTGGLLGLTKLQRFKPKTTFPNMILSGTLYVGSLVREWNAYQWLNGKLRSFKSALSHRNTSGLIASQSIHQISFREASVDYIFTDPPFGGNLMYSELNFLWESVSVKPLTPCASPDFVRESCTATISPARNPAGRFLMLCFFPAPADPFRQAVRPRE